MTLQEAIALIQSDRFIAATPTTWADLGCGSGLFTQAMAHLQPPESRIYALDTNRTSLRGLTNYNGVAIEPICQDFVRDEWPFKTVDGILMANSLHYVKDKAAFLEKANHHLAESGCFLLVEYDTDKANPWVPYPIRFSSLQTLFSKAGYSVVEKLQEKPSIYGRANLYSAYISR